MNMVTASGFKGIFMEGKCPPRDWSADADENREIPPGAERYCKRLEGETYSDYRNRFESIEDIEKSYLVLVGISMGATKLIMYFGKQLLSAKSVDSVLVRMKVKRVVFFALTVILGMALLKVADDFYQRVKAEVVKRTKGDMEVSILKKVAIVVDVVATTLIGEVKSIVGWKYVEALGTKVIGGVPPVGYSGLLGPLRMIRDNKCFSILSRAIYAIKSPFSMSFKYNEKDPEMPSAKVYGRAFINNLCMMVFVAVMLVHAKALCKIELE